MNIAKAQCAIDDCTIDYFRGGNGELLILLHGALADKRMWSSHIKELSKSFDVIALTQRHFGEPSDSGDGFGLNSHAQDLIEFIRQTTKQKAHLIGWSYGADVALNAVVSAPELFASLLLYEPGHPGYLSEHEMTEFGSDAHKMFGPIFQFASEGQIEQAVTVLINGSGNAEGYFDSQSKEAKEQQLDNSHTLIKQLNQVERPQLSKDTLSKISVPTSLVYGAKTRTLFRVVSEAAGNIIPNSRVCSVDSANHMLPIENPEKFSELIRSHILNSKG